MRRTLAILLAAVMIFAIGAPALAKEYPTRVIDVVYDDSGSMVKLDSGTMVDTWCQAKYAMEVFATMLEAKDTLNVFTMSEYDLKGASGGNKISISGAASPESRVAAIHGMKTKIAQTTPFRPVLAAAEHLARSPQQQKWLVILTDGKFERKAAFGKIETMPVADIESQLAALAGKGIKVVFLSIGEDAGGIANRPDQNIYFYKANKSHDTIVRITEICNRIFERNTIKNYKASSGTFDVDVPMEEMLIFAQGANVKIEALEINNEAAPKASEVAVCYSDRTSVAVNPQLQSKILVADKLKGVVASFKNSKGIFADGLYRLKISGADDVQIYYKPNITIGYDLTRNGKKLPVSNKLLEGKFTINFNLLNPITGKPVKSALLGNIDYAGTIEQNGRKMPVTNGSTIEIKPGEATIDVKGTFLDYNTVSINKKYRILEAASPLQMSVSPAKASVNIKELETMQPLLLSVKQNGQILTREKWNKMPLPEIKSDKNLKWEIKKGTEVGTFLISPKYNEKGKFKTDDGEIPFTVVAQMTHDEQLSTGELEAKMDIEGFTLLEKALENWKIILGGFALFLIVLGYILKKYLPSMKPETSSEGSSMGRPVKRNIGERLCSCLPYIPSRAHIDPSAFDLAASTVKLKATGSGGMIILNSEAFDYEPDADPHYSMPSDKKKDGYYHIRANQHIYIVQDRTEYDFWLKKA